MRYKMRKLYLIVKYYPYTSFTMAFAMLLCFITMGRDSFVFGCLVAMIAVIMFLHNIPTWPKDLPRGELSKVSVLNVIALLEEIGLKIPANSLYTNRPQRPLLCFILWSRGRVQRRLMNWMGIDPNGITISDKNKQPKNVAGSFYVTQREVFIDSEIKRKHPDAYLTTLVHELAHVFAHRFNIHSYIGGFEEDFTDMLCVFLGLGDVMLNGCVSMSTTEKWCGCYVERHYERLNVGYLTPLSLAVAEVIMQEMTCGFGKQRKFFNSRAYSMLTDVRIWLDLNRIDFRNKKHVAPEQYLQRLKTQIETLRVE